MALFSCATCWQPLTPGEVGEVKHYDEEFGQSFDHPALLPPGVLPTELTDPRERANDDAIIKSLLASARQTTASPASSKRVTRTGRRTAVDKGGQNIRVTVDAGDVRFEFTDDEVNDFDIGAVFATLGEAKAWALEQAIAERDSWAQCVRTIREATTHDVL